MNFHQKSQGLENRNSRNDRAITKTLHLSLNFDPSESFSNKKLVQIAIAYMEKIGFGEQPYLVYQHLDAGHPHLHIVATLIQEDGSRIPTHNIGRTLSQKARKEIEAEFNLMKAEHPKQQMKKKNESRHIERVVYGLSQTKKGINEVLKAVIDAYRYTSLAELNAILKQFNIMAD